ncbi:MAG TPA: hypothetical protein VED43_16435 [Mycobacterium sp.]|nr:hypothetical protein [Mycobacterium sp.]
MACADVRLDITDLYVFAGQSGTFFVMNVCPTARASVGRPARDELLLGERTSVTASPSTASSPSPALSNPPSFGNSE